MDPGRLNQVLIISLHRGSAVHYILPKLTNVKYVTLAQGITTLNWIRNHDTSDYLHVSLAVSDMQDYILEQLQLVTFSREELMMYSKNYEMYLE